MGCQTIQEQSKMVQQKDKLTEKLAAIRTPPPTARDRDRSRLLLAFAMLMFKGSMSAEPDQGHCRPSFPIPFLLSVPVQGSPSAHRAGGILDGKGLAKMTRHATNVNN